MLSRVKTFIPKQDFAKNVVTLMTGTTLAQAIPIAISPILTRIYTPEDFGLVALFVSITVIFGVIANGRYELAIMLPKKDEDAINIFALGLIITSCLSLFLVFLVLAFHDHLMNIPNIKDLSFWIYFIPVVVFFLGLYNNLNYFNNRQKNYKNIAYSQIVKGIMLSVIQLSIGFLKKGATGLFSGQIGSNIFANVILLKSLLKDKNLLLLVNKSTIIAMAKRYQNFPKFSLWSGLLNTASVQLPVILLTSFFMPSVVGYFSLSHRFITMPLVLIGSSIGQVFYQKSGEIKSDKEALKKLTFDTYKKLLQIGIVPFSTMTFFGDHIFVFFFGADWLVAGQYAQILSIWILFVFIISPLSNLFSTLELQKKSLYFNIVIFSLRILVLLIGGLIIKSALVTIVIYAVTGALLWIFWGLYLLNMVGVGYKRSFSYTMKNILGFMSFFGLLRYLSFYF